MNNITDKLISMSKNLKETDSRIIDRSKMDVALMNQDFIKMMVDFRNNPISIFNYNIEVTENIKKIISEYFTILDELINTNPYETTLFIVLKNVCISLKNTDIIKPCSHFGPFYNLKEIKPTLSNSGHVYHSEKEYKSFILCYSCLYDNVHCFEIYYYLSDLYKTKDIILLYNNIYIYVNESTHKINNLHFTYKDKLYFPNILVSDNFTYLKECVKQDIEINNF